MLRKISDRESIIFFFRFLLIYSIRYTYSVCFFGEAHQKSNTDSSNTSLGKFNSWSTTAEKGTNEYYLKQVYNEGQRCWNGPARSAKVRSLFSCVELVLIVFLI